MRSHLGILFLAGCGAASAPPDAPGQPARVVDVTSTSPDGRYTTGSAIPIVVTFDRAVTVTGTPTLALANGGPPVAYASGSGTTMLTFVYTVAATDAATDLDYASADALAPADAIKPTGTILTLPDPGTAGSLAANKALEIYQTKTFDFTGTLDHFMVPPFVTKLQLDVYGAEGGTSTGESGGMMLLGGKGAFTTGTFTVAPGDTLDVLVGQRGMNSNCGSGGGGGSWVVHGTALLAVAGGGGGGFHCTALGGYVGGAGRDTADGGAGVCSPMRTSAAGGTMGNGGTNDYGGGGGGWLTNGTSLVDVNDAGKQYPGAPAHGGGFGGGGGYYVSCCGNSGAGGGYSGGSGGTSDGCAGGGGGSMNMGASTMTMAGVRAGNGQIVITY